MDVSMEQLQAFVAAVDHGSFTNAGRSLKRAQSAISAQISALEDDLGVMLFKRTGRTPELTPIGQRVLREARVVLERRQHLIGLAQSHEHEVEQKLTVAFDQLYPEDTLGPLLAIFAKEFPHVELKLLFPLMGDVSELVVKGEADLGILWRQEEALDDELEFVRIAWASVVMVCGLDHPFAKAPVVYDELKRHRQILVSPRRGSETGRWRLATEIWSVESHWMALKLAKENIGWTLVSRDVVNACTFRDALVIPDIAFDGFGIPAPLDMVYSKTRPRGPAMRWMQERLFEADVGYGDKRYFSSKPEF